MISGAYVAYRFETLRPRRARLRNRALRAVVRSRGYGVDVGLVVNRPRLLALSCEK
jgi:hypothetical protein